MHCLVVSSFRSIPTPRLMPDAFKTKKVLGNTDSKINFFETSVESHLKYHKLPQISKNQFIFIATFNQTATVMNFFRRQMEYKSLRWVEMWRNRRSVKTWFSKGTLPKKALIFNSDPICPRQKKRQFYIVCNLMHTHIDVFYDYMDRYDYVCNTSHRIRQQSYHQPINIMNTTPA